MVTAEAVVAVPEHLTVHHPKAHVGRNSTTVHCGNEQTGSLQRTVEESYMGNSTGSTMYMFGAVIVIYLVGVLIYQGYLWIKKKREKKRDEAFKRGDE